MNMFVLFASEENRECELLNMTVIGNLYEGSYQKINALSVTRVFDLLMTHNNVMYSVGCAVRRRGTIFSQ